MTRFPITRAALGGAAFFAAMALVYASVLDIPDPLFPAAAATLGWAAGMVLYRSLP